MIRVGIYGYGNLGRGVETALLAAPDMTLSAVYTRRDPKSLTIATPDVPVLSADALEQRIRVLIKIPRDVHTHVCNLDIHTDGSRIAVSLST
jgi:dihydrodipicolinate reductase